MIYRKTIAINIAFLLCFFALKTNAQVQGRLNLVRHVINHNKWNEILKISTTIWYKGIYNIQEVPHVEFKTDSIRNDDRVFIKYYLFSNPISKIYSYYKEFAVNASVILQSSKIEDTYGGFDMNAKTDFDNATYIKLPDTIINNYIHKRFLFNNMTKWPMNKFIIYTRCDKKHIPFKYLKKFSEKVGCDAVRMETYYENNLVGIMEIEYVLDKLNCIEEKVFQIWEKK